MLHNRIHHQSTLTSAGIEPFENSFLLLDDYRMNGGPKWVTLVAHGISMVSMDSWLSFCDQILIPGDRVFNLEKQYYTTDLIW